MRAFQCWLLTTVCFLTMSLGSEWLSRWLKEAAPTMNHHQSTLFRILVLGIAFSIAANLVRPYLQSYVKRVHVAVRPGSGALAGIIGALILMVAVYFGFYYTYSN